MIDRGRLVQFTKEKQTMQAIAEMMFEESLETLDVRKVAEDPKYMSDFLVQEGLLAMAIFGPEAYKEGKKIGDEINRNS